jgi:hypothetical protein
MTIFFARKSYDSDSAPTYEDNKIKAEKIIKQGLKEKLPNFESYSPMFNGHHSLDSLFLDDSEFAGYKMIHSYRAENKQGRIVEYHHLFFFDKELRKITRVENLPYR